MNVNDVYNVTGSFEDYGMRMYDSRLGRFISRDPIANQFPWYSPYQFAGNKPIWAIDLDGLEDVIYQQLLQTAYPKAVNAILQLGNRTTIVKKFYQVLKNQNKYDVYFFLDKDVQRDGFCTEITSWQEYWNDKYFIDVDGKTIVQDGDSYLFDATDSDIEERLKSGKKIIIIGCGDGNISTVEDALSNPLLKRMLAENEFYLRCLDAIDTYVHEISAHAIRILEGTSTNAWAEHFDYFHRYAWHTPSVEEVYYHSERFINTPLIKDFNEVKKIFDDFLKNEGWWTPPPPIPSKNSGDRNDPLYEPSN